MFKQLKRSLVYSLALLTILPIYLFSNIDTAAASDPYQDEFFNGAPNTQYSEGNSSNWQDDILISGARFTVTANESASWHFTPEQSGIYSIYADWVIHPNNTSHAVYTIEDAHGRQDISVDQQKTAAGNYPESNTTGVESGFYLLASNRMLISGDYLLYRLSAPGISDENLLSAGHIKIVKTADIANTPPTAPVISRQMYFRAPTVHLSWQVSTDSGDAVTYDLRVDGEVVRRGITENFADINLPDGPHDWAVRASDGTSYSNWTPGDGDMPITIDTVAPVFDAQSLRYSSVDISQDPAVVIDNSVEARKVAGRFVVPMDGQVIHMYLNQLTGTMSETVFSPLTPLYLKDLSSLQRDALIAYFNSKIFNDAATAYYLKVVDGTEPIAYLKSTGTPTLIDGAYYSLTGGQEVDFSLLGNFPIAVYHFFGTMADIAGNKGEVNIFIEFTRPGFVLPAATNLQITMGENNAVLQWDQVPDAISYNIYHKKAGDSAYGAATNVLGNSISISGLEASTEYDFMVIPVSSQDVMGASASVSAVTKSLASAATVTPKASSSAPKKSYRAWGTGATTVAPAEAAPLDSQNGVTRTSPGSISDDSSSVEDESEKINWTPWFVLFALILLAGAATGAYFYWFAGEEIAPEAKKETVQLKSAVSKKTATASKSESKSKKKIADKPPTKRW